MKTRRNHRKTTTGRRKRHVKYRVQTRINHRKGTVSSARRHKFFKRGGQPQYSSYNTVIRYGRYGTGGVYSPSLLQIRSDQKEAADQAAIAAQETDKLDYPDVDVFVQNVKTINVTRIMEISVNFSILKLPQKTFDSTHVQNRDSQHPVIKTINNKTVKFYISYNGCNFYIYVDNTLYGQLQITTQKGDVINTEAICSNELLKQIKLDLINAAKAAN
jgi:hypothetical protein